MANSTKKTRFHLKELSEMPYRVGSSIVLCGLIWLLIGYLVYQHIINQESFIFFSATGLLWMVGNGAYFTSDFDDWRKHLLSIVIFFGLLLKGLSLITKNLQTIDVYNGHLLGSQLMWLALGSLGLGLIEIVFRIFQRNIFQKT